MNRAGFFTVNLDFIEPEAGGDKSRRVVKIKG